MEKLKYATGIKRYEIEDEEGVSLGILSIDTTDIGFFGRVSACKTELETLIKDAERLSLEVDDDDTEKIEELMESIDAQCKVQIDKLFGCEASAILFGASHCLSTHNGVTGVQRALEMLLPVVERDMLAEQAKSRARVSAYTKDLRQ